jgi:hypothetical protein
VRPQLRLVAAATFVAFACVFASVSLAQAGDAARANNDPSPTFRIVNDGARIEVVGLPPAAVAVLRDANLSAQRWRRLLTVAVATKEAVPPAPMLGAYAATGPAVSFTPRFPLRPGLEYHVIFNPSALPGNPLPDVQPVETTIALPKPPARPAATVTAVYPSGDVLPANLLKFYIHFSAPMTRGDSYRYIHLVDAADHEVPDAFLELGEELWDSDGTRLTLLFDPGRVKRGLKPNEDVGAPLVEGQRYTLVIDADWHDARRSPLSKEFRKTFRVLPPDRDQPNPTGWRLSAPRANTREPLVITFNEPLDHALVRRLLQVRLSADLPVAGRVDIADEENSWRFYPAGPWQTGNYELVVDPALEDRAGNSVGRPFEVTQLTHPEREGPVTLRFNVRCGEATRSRALPQ